MVATLAGAIAVVSASLGPVRRIVLEERYLAQLESADRETQRVAAEHLGRLRSPRAVEPLLDILTKDRFHGRVGFAIKALAQIGDPAVRKLVAVAERSLGVTQSITGADSEVGEDIAVRSNSPVGRKLVEVIVYGTGGKDQWCDPSTLPSIGFHHGNLLVRNSRDVHERLEKIIESLRRGALADVHATLMALGENAERELTRIAVDSDSSSFARAFAGFELARLSVAPDLAASK